MIVWCVLLVISFALGAAVSWFVTRRRSFLSGYATAIDDQFKRLRAREQSFWKVKTVKTELRSIDGGKK